MSDSYIAHIESGLKTPSLDITMALAEAFGFTAPQQRAFLEALDNSRVERSMRRIRMRGRAIRSALETMDQAGPGALRLIDLEKADEPVLIPSRGHALQSIAFSPDDALVAAVDERGQATVWDRRTLDPLATIPVARGSISCLAFTGDSTAIIAVDENGSIRVFDARTGRAGLQVDGPGRLPTALAASPEAAVLAVGDETGQLTAFSIEDGSVLWQTNRDEGPVMCSVFSPDGAVLVSAGEDGVLRAWDAGAGEEMEAAQHGGPITALAFSPDGMLVASGGAGGEVLLWNAVNLERLRTLSGIGSGVAQLAFFADGVTLAAVTNAGSVVLWDTRTGSERRRVEAEIGAEGPLAFARGGRWLGVFDEEHNAEPDEFSPQQIVKDLAADRDLLEAYQALKKALANPAMRDAVLQSLRAFAQASPD